MLGRFRKREASSGKQKKGGIPIHPTGQLNEKEKAGLPAKSKKLLTPSLS